MNAKELWDSMYAEKDLRPTDTCRGFAIHFAEAYHRAKVEGVTDEAEIEQQAIERHLTDQHAAFSVYGFKEGAKYVKDKLLNQKP